MNSQIWAWKTHPICPFNASNQPKDTPFYLASTQQFNPDQFKEVMNFLGTSQNLPLYMDASDLDLKTYEFQTSNGFRMGLKSPPTDLQSIPNQSAISKQTQVK